MNTSEGWNIRTCIFKKQLKFALWEPLNSMTFIFPSLMCYDSNLNRLEWRKERQEHWRVPKTELRTLWSSYCSTGLFWCHSRWKSSNAILKATHIKITVIFTRCWVSTQAWYLVHLWTWSYLLPHNWNSPETCVSPAFSLMLFFSFVHSEGAKGTQGLSTSKHIWYIWSLVIAFFMCDRTKIVTLWVFPVLSSLVSL